MLLLLNKWFLKGGSNIYYPLFLQLKDRPCLVVGGGKIAFRKASILVEYGSHVELVSPTIIPELEKLQARIKIIKAQYSKEYCQGKLLVIAATDKPVLNRQIALDAREAGALFNAVDQPELCEFIVPAIVNRGHLQIAISTGGNSPYLASLIRQEMEDRFGEEYDGYLQKTGIIRKMLKEEIAEEETRRKILKKIAMLVYEGGKKNAATAQKDEKNGRAQEAGPRDSGNS